jgi:hypothetical protein
MTNQEALSKPEDELGEIDIPKEPLKEKDEEEIDDEEVVDGLVNEEIERRKWCVEQATFDMETSVDNFIKVAEKIYDYVYGKRV